MNILGISGSPRKEGNSELIMEFVGDRVAERGFSFEKIFLSENKVEFCTGCDSCLKMKECVIDDAMQKFYPMLENAGGIIVCSPVYFGSVSGQLKTFFDRTRVLRVKGLSLKDKVGAGIAVGGSRNGGQELVIQAMHAWMHVHGMVVVGDNSHFGGTVHRPMHDDLEGMKTVKATVEKVCDFLERVKK